MKKSHIVNNIEKYYLGGLSKSVLWEVADKKVTINFSTEAKNAVGTLSFDLDLPDCTLAIYNTDALLRLINITNEDIDIIISEDNQKIKIQDNKFDLIYHLSEKDAIPTVPKVTETDYDFKFNVNDEFINKFLKAHNALEKTEEAVEAVEEKKNENANAKEKEENVKKSVNAKEESAKEREEKEREEKES